MADREKVIKGLKIERECVNRNCDRECAKCDLVQDREWLLSVYDDALELLKEQEPVELLDDGEDFVSIGDRMEITNRWKCGGCGNFVVYCETRPRIKFCHICGREFKRND